MNRSISLDEMDLIANAQSENELNSIWDSMMDWFCWTNKVAAKKALYCSLNEEAPAEQRLASFAQLKQLTTLNYQDNLTAYIKEDGLICIAITGTSVNNQVSCSSPNQATQYMMIWSNLDQLEDLSFIQRMKVLSCLESLDLLDSESKETTKFTSITQALAQVIIARNQLLDEGVFLPLSVEKNENSSITISFDGLINITADMQRFNFKDESWFKEERDPAQILEDRSPMKAKEVLDTVYAKETNGTFTIHGLTAQNQDRLQVESLSKQQQQKLIDQPLLCQQFVQMNINAFNHPDIGIDGSQAIIMLNLGPISSKEDDPSQNMKDFLVTMGKILSQLNLENIMNIPSELQL
ncbi:hypothetical protein [Shewanella surugensis]|uniref:Uncharacterized protein n=1 Tax=Shewanella surugensis TaxID=212020 RepID=A0ABT0LDE4_9GAMM|nr:hypothetical protein [Shewanella surugensis]MCL1125335.1 hypothetical protein [Shewanella surugensis]